MKTFFKRAFRHRLRPKSKDSKDASIDLAYQTALLALQTASPALRIAVIGANDGKINDPLYPLLLNRQLESCSFYLFEPQTILHGELRKTYQDHPNHFIFSAAVGPREALSLFTIHPDYWEQLQPKYAIRNKWPHYRAPTGIASLSRDEVEKWIERHSRGRVNPTAAIETLSVQSIPLLELLDKHQLEKDIDVLQVDAEGSDDNVIYNCGIETTRPKIILFEKSKLTDKRNDLLEAFLTDQSYTLISIGRDTIAFRKQQDPAESGPNDRPHI